MMLPLSLSYDHRAIDGADGIRFLRWVAAAFEEPFVIALNG
jgi:pyruvate dehydrogenase E2 component (dihydrolipoamide acetyltransferase)